MSRIVKQISMLTASLALLILAFRADAATGQASNDGLGVGSIAPGFTLHALNGTPYTLQGLLGHGYVLLVFWSTHDPFCQALIPDFKAVNQRYTGKGLTLVAINVGYEGWPDVQAYVEDNNIDYLVLDDDAQKPALTKAYGIVGTPTIVLVSPQGIIRYYGHHLPDLSRFLNTAKSGAGDTNAPTNTNLPPRTH